MNTTLSTLKFITGNVNKFNEAKQFLPELEQLNIDLLEIQSLDPKEIIEHKLKEAKKYGHINFFTEDISLVIDKYGFPGPLIKWVNQTLGHDLGVYFEGIVKGTLCRARGEDFGYNPIVIPEGHTKTYAEMSLEVKGTINHRAKALEKLKAFLEEKQYK